MGVSVVGIETGQTWIEENQKLEVEQQVYRVPLSS